MCEISGPTNISTPKNDIFVHATPKVEGNIQVIDFPFPDGVNLRFTDVFSRSVKLRRLTTRFFFSLDLFVEALKKGRLIFWTYNLELAVLALARIMCADIHLKRGWLLLWLPFS